MDLLNRTDAERSLAARFSALFGKYRTEAASLLGNPPDVANIPASFWDRVERETNEELAAALLLLIITSASDHGLHQFFAGDQPHTAAVRRAAETARSVRDTSRGMLADITDRWQRERMAAAADDEAFAVTAEQIAEEAGKVFSDSRAESIAITEATAANSIGSEMGIGATVGHDAGDVWITEGDERVCPICAPLHRTDRAEWARFFPEGPPAHPRCRCYLEYARQPVAVEVGS